MRRRDKLKEDGAVDGLVAACTQTQSGAERGDGHEVGASGANQAGHGGDEEGDVEGRPAADKVCRHGPEARPNDETSIFGDTEKGNALDREFGPHRWCDDGDGLQPEL